MSDKPANVGGNRHDESLTEDDILKQYAQELSPMLWTTCQIAGQKGVPSQLFAEARAVASHLSRIAASTKRSDKDCIRASRHMERCATDCRKWLCIHFSDEAKGSLAKLKQSCDLRLVRNGEYLEKIHDARIAADRAFREAKRKEAQGDNDSSKKYEQAVLAYEKLYYLVTQPDRVVETNPKSPDSDKQEISTRIADLKDQASKDRLGRTTLLIASVVVAILGLMINFL